MKKVVIYKVKIQGGGTYYSLRERTEWNRYVNGHTSNEGEYYIPHGFEIAESQNGELCFYKNDYHWEFLSCNDSYSPRITDGAGTIINLKKVEIKENL